jgi:rod shape-determining protein MreC
VVSIGLIVADHRYHHLGLVRSVLKVMTYPLQFAAHAPVAVGRWVGELWSNRGELQQQNLALDRENLTLKSRLQQLEALEAENMRLRDLLGSSLKIGERVLIAELQAVDLDPYRQRVVINKGSSSGVFVGQPVLDANAVMGQVVEVGPWTATVILITDATHSLPVQVNRNGLRSIAEGTGLANRLELAHLPYDADIREGDLLVTSGLGGVFPRGYPVGRVSAVKIESGKPFATAVITPAARLDRIREMLLVWTLSPEGLKDRRDPSAQAKAAP